MPTPQQRRDLDRLRRELAAVLAETELALPGTITERMRRCAYQGCRCRADPPQLHGPYWQWTRKVEGKTVTRNLSVEQAERYQAWIDDARRLREALRALEEASAEIAEAGLRDG